MTSTEARRIRAQHGDTVPEADYPPLPDGAAEVLRALGCPTAQPVAQRRSA